MWVRVDPYSLLVDTLRNLTQILNILTGHNFLANLLPVTTY